MIGSSLLLISLLLQLKKILFVLIFTILLFLAIFSSSQPATTPDVLLNCYDLLGRYCAAT